MAANRGKGIIAHDMAPKSPEIPPLLKADENAPIVFEAKAGHWNFRVPSQPQVFVLDRSRNQPGHPPSAPSSRLAGPPTQLKPLTFQTSRFARNLENRGIIFLFEHSGILAPVPPKLSDDPKTLCIPASIVSHILSWDRQNLLHFARHIGRHQREDKWVRIVGPGSIFEAKNSVEVIFRLYQFNKCGHDPTYPLHFLLTERSVAKH